MLQFRNVLLVDDDADDQELFAEALATVDKSAIVHRASDGNAALEVLKDIYPPAPDVIFLDLNMPRKNGIEFIKEVKQQTAYQAIPVIVYSTSSHYKEQMAELGAAHYMVKQNSFKALCIELGDLLSRPWK